MESGQSSGLYQLAGLPYQAGLLSLVLSTPELHLIRMVYKSRESALGR